MDEKELKELCTKVSGLFTDLEDYLNPEQFIDEVENYEEIIFGAILARGYLEETVELTEKSIPFIQASAVALQEALDAAEGDEDEDEDEDEDDE